ncbi:MAG: hypothetical protein VX593_06790 [Pseudomonadota bacterium]|nr:hypothetical protein [Pseudomonadota bacterium]
MFDARSTAQKETGLGFGLAVTAAVAALFLVALYFPSVTGSGKAEAGKAVIVEQPSSGVLEATFSDKPTLDYVTKLRATFPSAATDLEDQVERATRRGADNIELGLLVLQAGARDIAGSADRLARADAEYVDVLIQLSTDQLSELQRSGAPYCMGNDLMMFAGLSDQELYRAVFDRVGHGAGLYEFMLAFNGILLDAIRDARADPVAREPINYADQQSLQALGITLMTKPQIVRLLTTEGKARSDMDAVLADTDFCDLAKQIATQINDLPEPTKGRVWAEGMHQVASGRWRYTLYRYTGY